MESSSWYSQVNFELDWEHPLNQVLFFDPFPSYMRPGTPEKFTTTGYNLTHYMVNPHVFGVGSNIATEDLIGGKDHNFLVGEIAGDFVPGGYPYLWRELIWPINGSSQSYGGWADGAHFCMASGAVRFLSNETEAAALPEVVQHQSAPGTHLVPTMAREFAYSSRPRFQHLRFESETPRIHKGDWGTSIWIDRENHEAYAANLFLNAEETTASTINLDSFIRQYGATEVLQILTGEFDDSDAHSVSYLSKLRVLRVYDIELTDAGITSLKNLSQLRYFSAFMTAEEAAKLASMLPKCEIQPRTDYRRDWMH